MNKATKCNDAGQTDSLITRNLYGAIGPIPYELPPEKTKEQLLEEAYVEKHKEMPRMALIFKNHDLLSDLHLLGTPSLDRAAMIAQVVGQTDSTIAEGLQKSILEYLQLGDQQMVAHLQNRLGVQYAESGNYDKAMACFSNALALEQDLKHTENIIWLSCNLATLHKFRGNKEIADEYYQLMYKTAIGSRDLNAQACSLERLAILKAEKGHFLEAQLDLIKKVLPLYKRAKNERGRVDAYNNLAYVYALEKKYTESRWFYLQAIKVASNGGNAEDLAYSFYYLAGIKRVLKEYQLAIEDYLRAIAYASKTGDDLLKMRIYDEMGDIYIHTKDYMGASSSLKAYQDIKQSLNLDKQKALLDLAQLGR